MQALAFASTIVSWKHRTWLGLKVAMKPLALSGIITTILLDAIIAFVLCVFLFKHRDVEGRNTRKLLKKVGLYAINTGLVSSVLSVCNLATVSFIHPCEKGYHTEYAHVSSWHILTPWSSSVSR